MYVAAEGVAGLKSRVRAWKRANSYLDVDTIYFIPEAVQLLDSKEVSRLLATITEYELEPKLIVFDTLARCFVGGDENSATAMGHAVHAITHIQAETGSAVLLVHHTRKGDNVERGSSALRSALDTMISMRKDGPLVTLSCAKMKDAEEFSDIHLRLVERESSCVLELAVPPQAEDELDGTAHSLVELLADHGLRHGEWKLAAKVRGVSTTTFERARRQLMEMGLVFKVDDGRWMISGTQGEPVGTTSTRSFRTGTVEPHGSLPQLEIGDATAR